MTNVVATLPHLCLFIPDLQLSTGEQTDGSTTGESTQESSFDPMGDTSSGTVPSHTLSLVLIYPVANVWRIQYCSAVDNNPPGIEIEIGLGNHMEFDGEVDLSG